MKKLIYSLSIKNRIFFALAIVLFIGFLINGVLVISNTKTNVKNEIGKELNSQMMMLKSVISGVNQYNQDVVALVGDQNTDQINQLENKLLQNIRHSLKSTKIGETGYYYIMDSKGNLIVHPTAEGKNISKHGFIQTMMREKSGIIEYPWEGEDKVVAYQYYEPKDWIIAGGSYLKEFIGPTIQSIIIEFVVTSIVILILTMVILSYVFQQSVLRPISRLEKIFNSVAKGDLTHTIEKYNKDEIGIIIGHVDKMIEQMNSTMLKVNDSASEVHSSAQAMSTSSGQMSVGSESQAEQVTQVEVAVHEMTATIQEISMNVEEVNSEVNHIKESATTGGEILEETVSGINNLSTAVIETASSIKELGSSSEQIGEILSVISDIADQTNLLALNAAIEAARAGEHGRGFAVVADEVRKLAERTVKATSEIDGMIANIQKEVSNSVTQMDSGVSMAQDGAMMVGNLKMSLEEIIRGVIDIADKIASVGASVEEQSATSQQISSNMADIAAVAQESASIASENSDQAVVLRELADQLQVVVNSFVLKK